MTGQEVLRQWRMDMKQAKSEYISKFCARTRDLRAKKDWTQAEMATALGVTEEQYRKYESRTPLPHYYIEKFALITDVSIEYVVTGNDKRKSKPRNRDPEVIGSFRREQPQRSARR